MVVYAPGGITAEAPKASAWGETHAGKAALPATGATYSLLAG